MIVFLLLFTTVNCNNHYDNVTAKLLTQPLSSFNTHQNRLITFNTKDEEISVELAFSVPFITVPIRPMLNGALANINVGALILGGIMIFGAAVVIPALLFFLTFKTHHRNIDKNELWGLLRGVDQLLKDNNIDVAVCIQKSLCDLVKTSMENLEKGENSSLDKLILDVLKSDWVQSSIAGTSWEASIYKGTSMKSCREYECQMIETLQLMGDKLRNTL